MLKILNNILTFIDIENPHLNLCVNFLTPRFFLRIEQTGKKTLLIKAIGDKGSGKKLKIIDATAGLGRDAFLIAHRGHQVTLIEKDKTVHALLEDGLKRAQHKFPETVARMHLIHADSLKNLCAADAIYLDPMFPERKKSALVKKDMQAMQKILGHQNNIEMLLQAALNSKATRVVLKRPKLSETLLKPDFQLHSKTYRFDVYLDRRDKLLVKT